MADKANSTAAETGFFRGGDHVVLDMLNTVALLDGAVHDFWENPGDVQRWLVESGLGDAASGLARARLLSTARELRETIRGMVEARKARRGFDATAVNRFLAKGASHIELVRSAGKLQTVRRHGTETAEQLLMPLAEAAAEFFASVDFGLVRHCEGTGCVLWFLDRTKSHRRRWCSMEVCGNRHKVAAYRARQTGS